MKTLRPFLITVGTSLLISSCLGPPPPHPGPHVAVSPGGIGFGIYETLPPGYTSPYYFYGSRYYWGGRWEPGHFFYHGRHYEGRYFHNGRYLYGGRFHAGGPGHPHR